MENETQYTPGFADGGGYDDTRGCGVGNGWGDGNSPLNTKEIRLGYGLGAGFGHGIGYDTGKGNGTG